MTRNRRSPVVFLTILGVSILLHGFGWWWLHNKDWVTPQSSEKATITRVEIKLQPPAKQPAKRPQPIPEPEAIPELEPIREEHNPLHNADSFASSNTVDKTVKTLVSEKPPTRQNDKHSKTVTPDAPSIKSGQSIKAPMDTDTLSKSEPSKPLKSFAKDRSTEPTTQNEPAPQATQALVDNQTTTSKVDEHSLPSQGGGSLSTEFEFEQSSHKIPDEILATLGNMQLLDDYNLSDIDVKDPYSEVESQRIKMVNRYLQRMEKQIKTGWVKPLTTNQQFSGVIKFSLTPYGQLTEAYIYLGSGNSILDQSALEAVKRVKRFAVPESAAVAAKYYNSLRFQYSSHEFSGESIPIKRQPTD